MHNYRTRLLATCSRFAIAFGVAVVTGPLATLFLFQEDVQRQIAENFAKANAPLIDPIAAREDASLTANRQTRDQLQARLASMDSAIEALRQGQSEAGPESPEIQEQSALVARLADEKAAADKNVADAEALVTDELAGVPGANRSGRPGEGLRYRAAMVKLGQAKDRAAAAADALAQAQERLRSLRAAAAGKAASINTDNAVRLRDLLAEREKAQAEMLKLDEAYRVLVTERPERVARALDLDPRRIPEAAGLTAQLAALWQINSTHPENLVETIGLHVVFVGLELVVMLAAARISRTDAYTKMQVLDEKATEIALAVEIQRRYDAAGFPRYDGPAAEAALPDPEPPLDNPPAGAAAAAVPLPEPEPLDAHSALSRYFMAARVDAQRLEDEESDMLDERAARLDKAGMAPASNVPAKRGRGRPKGSKTRNRASPLNGSAALLQASANPPGDDGTRQNEAEKEKEEV
jgi:hypothetical protein